MATIRRLEPRDDRAGFRSGEADLDRFFAKYAGQNQFRNHIGTTYVAVDEDSGVLGYVSVSPAILELEELPVKVRKGLPQYPLPVLRLARLAVSKDYQGQGLGKALTRFVLELATRMAEDVGCFAVVVDAKPGRASFYEGLGLEPLDLVEGDSPARPQPTTLFLPVAEIRAAMR